MNARSALRPKSDRRDVGPRGGQDPAQPVAKTLPFAAILLEIRGLGCCRFAARTAADLAAPMGLSHAKMISKTYIRQMVIECFISVEIVATALQV